MVTELSSNVKYQLPLDEARIDLNALLGTRVAFEFGGEVHRVASSARFTAVIKQIYRPKARIVKRTRQGAGADP